MEKEKETKKETIEEKQNTSQDEILNIVKEVYSIVSKPKQEIDTDSYINKKDVTINKINSLDKIGG